MWLKAGALLILIFLSVEETEAAKVTIMMTNNLTINLTREGPSLWWTVAKTSKAEVLTAIGIGSFRKVSAIYCIILLSWFQILMLIYYEQQRAGLLMEISGHNSW